MQAKLIGFVAALAIVSFAQLAAAQFRPGMDVYTPPPATTAPSSQGTASGPSPNAIGPGVSSPDADANSRPPRPGRPRLGFKVPPPSYNGSVNTGANPELNDPNLSPDLATAQRACMQNCMSGPNALGYDACYKSCFE